MADFDSYLDWCVRMDIAGSEESEEDEGPDPDAAYDAMRDDEDCR